MNSNNVQLQHDKNLEMKYLKQKIYYNTEKRTKSVGESKPGINGQSNPGPNGQSKPGVNGKPKPKPDGESKPGPNGQSKPGANGKPKPKPDGESKPGPNGQSKPGPNGQSKPGPNGQSKPGPNGQSKPGVNGTPKPKSDGGSKPGANGTPKPKSEGESKPEPNGQSKPGANETPKPKSEGEFKPGPNGQSKPGVNGKPKPKSEGESKPGPNGQSKPGANKTPKPKSEGESKPGPNGQSKPGVNGKPKLKSDGESKPGPNEQSKPEANTEKKSKSNRKKLKQQQTAIREAEERAGRDYWPLNRYNCPYRLEFGFCSYDEVPWNCRFSHPKTEQEQEENIEHENEDRDQQSIEDLPFYLCVHYLQGNCQFKYHTNKNPVCCISGFHIDQRDHSEFLRYKSELIENYFFGTDQKLSCNICKRFVLAKNFPQHRRFGILSRCFHVFCATCLRPHRKLSKKCPICRKVSPLAMDSPKFPLSVEEKRKLFRVPIVADSKEPTSKVEQESNIEETSRQAIESSSEHRNSIPGRICQLCSKSPIDHRSNSELQLYGILENCAHIFCHRCIIDWRHQSGSEKCPICLLRSRRMISIEFFIEDPAIRRQIFVTLLENLPMEYPITDPKLLKPTNRDFQLRCEICQEKVLDHYRPIKQRQFGILENCRHVFCFVCIFAWHTQHENCPICGVRSKVLFNSLRSIQS